MAKKSSSKAVVQQPVATATSIDDIFASSSKVKVPEPSGHLPKLTPTTSKSKSETIIAPEASSSTLPTTSDKPKKKKKKTIQSFIPDDQPPSRAEKVVETVVDPSLARPMIEETAAAKVSAAAAGKPKKRDRKAIEEDMAFRDSRGDGPRRKTEEGFLIFKEAELGINPEAGGTPLCPFDCDCCF